jgi:UDP-hydrolysing UDP-N-acetyl-D-glucosamine 2-epimerase
MKKSLYKNFKQRKICIFTTNRADYGHLKELIKKINYNKKLKLQLVVTGSHLSKKHGFTVNEIVSDKITINQRINIDVSKNFRSDEVIKTNSKALVKFNSCLNKLKPDIVLILGDRYELLPIAEVTLFKNIPLAHLHGGEVTSGVFDEQIRHAITKLADIHFVANKIFYKNVQRLGENKKNIFNVGSLGCENLDQKFFEKKEKIEEIIKTKLMKKNLAVTLHPLNNRSITLKTIKNLLKALSFLKETRIIFTGTNPDLNSDIIFKEIDRFIKKNKNAILLQSLGQKKYLSLLRHMDGILGNSSSGFIEAPVLKIPVVNIGNRQFGRPLSLNIIQSDINTKKILLSINKIYKKKFIKKIKKTKSFYFNKNTSKKIIDILINKNLKNIKIKKFTHDTK